MIWHRPYRRLIDGMFDGDGAGDMPLSSDEWDRLFGQTGHLRGERRCARCRSYYEKRRRAQGPELDDETLAPAESRAILRVIEERLERLDTTESAVAPEAARTIRGRLWVPAGFAAVATLVALVFYVAFKQGQTVVPDDRQPEFKAGRRPSADYYCEFGKTEKHLVLPGETCEVGATVRVRAYAQPGLSYVSFVVCDRGLSCRVTATARSNGEDVSLTSPPVPLLDRVQYFIVWSPEEISDRHVSRAVDSLIKDGRCVHDIEQLPIKRNDAQVPFWIHPKNVTPL